MDDDLSGAINLLRSKRAFHAEHITRIDRALEALLGLTEGAAASPSGAATPTMRPRTAREKLVALLDEEDHEWSTPEIVQEWKRRNDPIEGSNPEASVRAALKVAMKKRQVFKTGTGRYKSIKFFPKPLPVAYEPGDQAHIFRDLEVHTS